MTDKKQPTLIKCSECGRAYYIEKQYVGKKGTCGHCGNVAIFLGKKSKNPQKNMEKEFFNKLAEELEKLFPKGERCSCGKKLPCRSRALAFNGMANVFFRDLLKKQVSKNVSDVEKNMDWEEKIRKVRESWGEDSEYCQDQITEIVDDFLKAQCKELIEEFEKRIPKEYLM